MQHSIEDLIKRLNVMKDKAVEIHRIRNQYSKISGLEYDKAKCQTILDDIQSMAYGIANDKQGDDFITEMDSWKEKG